MSSQRELEDASTYLSQQQGNGQPDLAAKSHDSPVIDAEAEYIRLAALTELDYERERKPAANRLGVRVAVLDNIVESERARTRDLRDPRSEPIVEPWPDPVDGAKLLTDNVTQVGSYVVMGDAYRDTVALWALFTHAHDAFWISPRLAITSAEKRSGKTTLLDILTFLVPRPYPTANATAPVIFRTIDRHSPTVLMDEADTFLRSKSDLHGVLNSGHRRGGTFTRLVLVGEEYVPRRFNTWAPVAIAKIGRLPDTLADRSIDIPLQRRKTNEIVKRFRADRADELGDMARKADRWARDNMEALRRADPEIPDGINDRAADNWTPLLAIADQIGGEWPERARSAMLAITSRSEADDSGSLRELALRDIREIFDEVGLDRIRSAELVERLAGIEGRPWAEWGPTRQRISRHGLARLLKPFSIAPSTLRFGNNTAKGYQRSQFEEAFARYL
jgi:hypothetical protein